MHTESIWHRMCLLPGGVPVQLGVIILSLAICPFGVEEEAAAGLIFLSIQAYSFIILAFYYYCKHYCYYYFYYFLFLFLSLSGHICNF